MTDSHKRLATPSQSQHRTNGRTDERTDVEVTHPEMNPSANATPAGGHKRSSLVDVLYGCYAQDRCAQTVSELAGIVCTDREARAEALREHLATQRGHVAAHLHGTADRFAEDARHLRNKQGGTDTTRATAAAYSIVAAELRNLADGLPA